MIYKNVYSYLDKETGNIYLLKIKSEKLDDWLIEVYDCKYNLQITLTRHGFTEVPQHLKTEILSVLDVTQQIQTGSPEHSKKTSVS